MEKTLAVTRWILHKIFLILLGLLIWALIPALAISVNVTEKDQVKSWLTQSNTYQNFSNQSLSFVEIDNEKSVIEEATSGSLNEDELINAIRSALPVEFIQEQAETVIDGFYSWLEGETASPKFSISFESQLPQIEKALRSELEKQVSQFPECSLEEVTSPVFDPYEATCIPPGVDPQPQIDQAVEQFINSEDSIFNQEFTGEDLDLSKEVKLNGPVYFSTAEMLPLLYWSSLIALTAVVILTSRHWTKGLKEAGGTIFGATVFMVVLSFISQRLADAPGRYLVNQEGSESEIEAARAIFEPLAKVATQDFASTSLFFASITLLIGVVLWVAGWKLTPKKSTSNDSKGDSEPGSNSSANKSDDDVPELLREDGQENNLIDRVEEETLREQQEKNSAKEKKRDKIKSKLKQTKKRLIQ